jgi:hypothetical protein
MTSKWLLLPKLNPFRHRPKTGPERGRGTSPKLRARSANARWQKEVDQPLAIILLNRVSGQLGEPAQLRFPGMSPSDQQTNRLIAK